MKAVAMICPSCGGQIELDQDREFGFCCFCGTKIYLENAVQNIKGSVSIRGAVKIDQSDRMQSALKLAQKAVDLGDWTAAARRYQEAMSYDPDDDALGLFWAICTITPAPLGLIQDDDFKKYLPTFKAFSNDQRKASFFFEIFCKKLNSCIQNADVKGESAHKEAFLKKLFEICNSTIDQIETEIPSITTTPSGTLSIIKFYGKVGEAFEDAAARGLGRHPAVANIVKRKIAALDDQRRIHAREYWAQNPEQGAALQDKKDNFESLLKKCGALDFKRKKELRKKLDEVNRTIDFLEGVEI